jgi:hypothetical protein
VAKAYFPCARCGATCSCWSTSGKQAESRARWLKSKGELCDTCKATEREQLSAAAAAENAANDLPALTGSDKQIAWAEALRADQLAFIDAITGLLQGDELPADMPGGRAAALRAQARDLRDNLHMDVGTWGSFVELVAEQTAARWWIDTRDLSMRALLLSLRDALRQRLAPPAPAPLPEAAQETLLRPAGEPVSPHIAEIGWSGSLLFASLPVRDERFRQLMRDRRLEWRGERWQRSLGPTSGTAVQRAAELAHVLLGAGFMVRLADDEARAQAIAGSFEPEHRHWFVAITGGGMKGWIKAEWPRGDDFFEPLRAISGSRMHSGGLYLPASSADEVAEFAAVHDFRFTPGAQALVDDYHAAIAAGAVVEARPGQAPRLVRLSDVPAPLQAPEHVEVDDGLLDHD